MIDENETIFNHSISGNELKSLFIHCNPNSYLNSTTLLKKLTDLHLLFLVRGDLLNRKRISESIKLYYDKRILIVEDEPLVALDFQHFLSKNGYSNISSFFTGKDALENINIEKPDLVLLDIKLKDSISGLDVAATLKELNIPFIFVSAFSDNDTYQKASNLKPAKIFCKPVNYVALLDAIESNLNDVKKFSCSKVSLLSQ